MISVCARTAYPRTAPSPRVRVEGFIERLAVEGVDLRYRPSLTDEEYALLSGPAPRPRKVSVLLRAGARASRDQADAQLEMVHRLIFLAPIPGTDPPKRLDLYDFDDALYLGSLGDNNRGAAPLKREAARWRSYVRRARVVIAGSSHLAAVARKERTGQIEVIPSCVEPSLYSLRDHQERPVPTVGWMGSASTVGYLDPVFAAFERINRNGLRARLLVVGGRPDFSAPWLEVRPWDLRREAADLGEFDVGVMPLPDDAWARGKCGYKLLQYFATGVPAIASRVGVAPHLIGSDRGMLADGVKEWEAALLHLATRADVRGQMGSNARVLAERDYSYARWAPELRRVIQDLA